MSKTVFVTGASGYIARHIINGLLNEGHHVIGSLRSLDRATEIREAISPHLNDDADLDNRLQFATLDLTSDDGWDTALTGADVLMHTASPFPLTQPDDEAAVIRPAVDGAIRALRAAKAAGVTRVILTSSAVAVMHGDLPDGRAVYTEDDWTDVDHPSASAYVKSKTLAERAAWDFVANEAPEISMTTINPGFVMGAPLGGSFGTSIKVAQRILAAKDPMLPEFGFPMVDVHDVALAHIRAMTKPNSAGQRIIVADRFQWYRELAKTLSDEFPDRKISFRRAPNFLVRLLAVFDRSVRSVLPILNRRMDVSNARAKEVLGLQISDADKALRDTAHYLVDNDLI